MKSNAILKSCCEVGYVLAAGSVKFEAIRVAGAVAAAAQLLESSADSFSSPTDLLVPQDRSLIISQRSTWTTQKQNGAY